MKKIEVTIKPFQLEEVKSMLVELGVEGMTVSEVRVFNRRKSLAKIYRGNEYSVDLLPETRIEMVVSEGKAEQIVAALSRAGKAGKIADGKIFVLPIEQSIRIRNGEVEKTAELQYLG